MSDGKLQKAEITVLDGSSKNKKIRVQFNPTEYTVTTDVHYAGDPKKAKGESEPTTDYTGGELEFKMVRQQNLTVELWFDSYEKRTDVRKKTKLLKALTQPTVNAGKQRVPPRCLFSWGLFRYKGVIVSFQEHFTMFLPSGIPVRCKVTVTFKPVLDAKEIEAAQGKPNERLWTVKMGERLDIIAHKAIADSTKWRMIADFNRIDDPLSFPRLNDIGRTIIIPDDDGAVVAAPGVSG